MSTIIAICQSGGEFETTEDGVMSYKGGEAFAIDIDQETKISDFKEEVADNFGLSKDSISVKYLLPSNKKTLITIAKDRDLTRLLKFSKDSDTIDVYIIVDETPVKPVSKKLKTRSSKKSAPAPAAANAIVTPDLTHVDATHFNNGAVVDEVNETPISTLAALSASQSVVPSSSVPPCSVAFPFAGKPPAAEADWGDTITGVDQRFDNFREFRDALHKFSIAHGFDYKYKKKEKNRVSVICKTEGCPWRIYASTLPTTELLCIKRMNPTHTCEGAAANVKYRATRSWVGKVIKEKLKVSPDFKPRDVAEYIERECGIKMNYAQARRARDFAREMLQGSYKEAYSQLPYFCDKIIETNPGSCATFCTKEDSSFSRLFVSFNASILGFQLGCRPLIFLESYPSDTKYQEIVLAATGVDGNDNAFPVAFAVVDVETDENWDWFLTQLKSALSISRRIIFVADSRKGLNEPISKIFESSGYHGYCVRSLAEKLNDDFKGKLSHEARRIMINDFYAAAYASKADLFERSVNNIKRISSEAFYWIVKSDAKHWANAFLEGASYNHMTANLGKEFYGWLLGARELTITKLVDALRGKMMEAIYARRMECNQWVTMLTPAMEDKIRKNTALAQSLQVMHSHGYTFQVRAGEHAETVDIERWDCSCREWQLTGLPCCHAIAVFGVTGRNLYDYCSQFFTVESYRLTYAESIHPVPTADIPVPDEMTPVVAVSPPPPKRPPGRPKSKQAESIDDIKRQTQCSKCKSFGHNKRKCQDITPVQLLYRYDQVSACV